MKKLIMPDISACRKQVQILISVCFVTFLFTNNVYSQAGQKHAVEGNIYGPNALLGSNNYADLSIITNAKKLAVFTKDGTFDMLGESRFRKRSVFDSLLTAFAIRVQTIQANSLTVIYNAQIDGLLTVGNTLNFDGTNQTISSTTGIINFSNNALTTTGTITADTINASSASISNLTAGNITATGIQTQTINTGELLINGLPPQIGDTINVNVVNAGNIVIDGTATQIYSTNGVIDFNNNNIKNVGKLTVSQLGINTPNPIASTQVSGTDELNTTIGLIRYSDDDRSSRLSFVKYRGTMANPKSVLSGDRLGIISYHGFDGVQFQSSDMIKGVATENFNPTGRGSKIEFSTTPNGSTTDHIALILDNDQTARFAGTVYAPNIVISDKIYTKEAEFDSIRINEKLYVEKEFGAGRATFDTITIGNKIYANGSLTTDTVHAIKQISVNNTLQVEKQDTTDYAEIFTKDESSLYIQSKEGTATEKNTIINAYTGKVGIGTTDPTGSEKLTVVGNTRLQGNINISGTITANDLTIANTFSTQRIVTTRITSPDSIIAFGDSTILFKHNLNRIYADQTPNQSFKGIGIGFAATATGVNSTAIGRGKVNGDYSVVIGNYLEIPAGITNSIVIGSGYNTPNPLINNISNSLMIGFNSNLPTLVVTQASGLNTTGNVGIGTNNPQFKLHVANGDILIQGENNFTATNDRANIYLGNYSYFIESDRNVGLRIGIDDESNIVIKQSNGFVGIGEYEPQAKLDVNGNIRIQALKSLTGGDRLITVNGNGDLDNFSFSGNSNDLLNGNGDWVPGGGGWLVNGSEMYSIPEYVGIGTLNPPTNFAVEGTAYINKLDVGSFQDINDMDLSIDGDCFISNSLCIGTTSNSNFYSLFVCGTIGSLEWIVEDFSCADFVFDENHKRMNYLEKEKWFKEKKHLPGIASEKEVELEGLKVSETITGIIKNIEENSLDIIDLYKIIEVQRKEIEYLKEEIKVLTK